MTVLENSIHIDAPPEKVWSVLTSLDLLERYDPGISKSEIVTSCREGPGSARRCELKSGGWFKEKVADWRPNKSLSFELFECTLPVRRLKHSYTLEYVLELGAIGKLMDAMMIRKKWDAGIKGFFAGLKYYVETGLAPSGKES